MREIGISDIENDNKAKLKLRRDEKRYELKGNMVTYNGDIRSKLSSHITNFALYR